MNFSHDILSALYTPCRHHSDNPQVVAYEATIANLLDLTQEDINIRSKIYSVFVTHTDKLINSMIQNAREIGSTGVYTDGEILIPTKPFTSLTNADINRLEIFMSKINATQEVRMSPHWREFQPSYTVTAPYNFNFGRASRNPLLYEDIITIYGIYKRKTYKDALYEIFAHIKRNKALFTHNKEKVAWFQQERYPISIKAIESTDTFMQSLQYQCFQQNKRNDFFWYKNEFNNTIGFNFRFENNNGHEVSVFYALWRRYNSPSLYLLPLPLEKPYMVYNSKSHHETLTLYDDKGLTSSVWPNQRVVYNKEIPEPKFHEMSIPYGIQNLDKINFAVFYNKNLYLPFDHECYNRNFLSRIKHLADEHNVTLLFTEKSSEIVARGIRNDQPGFNLEYLPINNNDKISISFDDFVIKKGFLPQNTTTREQIKGFAEAGQKLPNQNRKRKNILFPVVQSGTITWLFAKEKIGKTLLAQAIAYVVGKGGGRDICGWKAEEAQNVLYIDGEMPADRFASSCKKIMRGFGEQGENIPRPFAVYLFAEDGLDYDSIIDEEWLKEHKSMLFAYDLIILDNYYSLNQNRIDIKPFLKLLKEIVRKDIAVIVIDHTNTDGNLQGSILKRRAADLGIRLDDCEENTINISYEFDRFGVEKHIESNPTAIIFTDSEIKFTKPKKEEDKKIEQQKLSDKDKFLLYVYALCKNFNFTQEQVGNFCDKAKSTVNEYVRMIDLQIKGEDPPKKKVSNIILFKDELEKISKLSKDEIIEELNYLK